MAMHTPLDPIPPMWKVPTALTPLLGREQEVVALCALLTRSGVRLLTLVGPGGIGKTRLAMQVAAGLRTHFAHGICFVSLTAISDPDGVIPTIAQALGCQGPPPIPLGEQVKRYLQEKAFLLILDTFEHVISAVPLVEELLLACPDVTILATSRAVLHVQGEQEFPVPPLALPSLNHVAQGKDLSEYAAITLFLQRARAVLPTFEMTTQNRRTIAQICIQLDGLPLAIELAAARVKVLPTQALLARLDERLLFLTAGARTSSARQQTLRNTFKWSYDLLTPEEQALFRLLSVFVGGCSLEAAEAVYRQIHGQEGDVITVVASLVDNSLLQQTGQEGEEPRLLQLSTIREYGWECSRACGEEEVVSRAHAQYYLAFAEQGECHLCPKSAKDGEQQLLWLTRFSLDQENLRAALLFFLQHQEAKCALRLCLAMAFYCYWSVGNWEEMISWFEAARALPGVRGHPALHAEVLGWLGNLNRTMSQIKGKISSEATAQLEESVARLREAGEQRRLIVMLGFLGAAYQYLSRDEVNASAVYEEGIALGRILSDTWRIATPLCGLASLLEEQGDLGRARALLEECLLIGQQIGGQWGLALLHIQLASVASAQGEDSEAVAFAHEALRMAHLTGFKAIMVMACYYLGDLARRQSDETQASAWYTRGLAIAREMGYYSFIPSALCKLGAIALLDGETARASQLVQEGLERARKIGDQQSIGWSTSLLGEIAYQRGDETQARVHFRESLSLVHPEADPHTVGRCLLGLARLASKVGQFWQAARLVSKAGQFWQTTRPRRAVEHYVSLEHGMTPREQAFYAQDIAALRAQLGEGAFATAQAEGRTMTLEDLLATENIPTAGLMTSSPQEPFQPPGQALPDELTAREVEVLRLVAQGLTDAQIAKKLVISPRTVNFHLTSIYRKIQVSSRVAATRYAIEHALA